MWVKADDGRDVTFKDGVFEIFDSRTQYALITNIAEANTQMRFKPEDFFFIIA